MRQVVTAFSLGALTVLAGCNHWPHNRGQNNGATATTAAPSAAELVASVNQNAQRIQGLECQEVSLDCTEGLQSVHLEALMACQKPRNFRVSARVVGKTEVDMGSNNEEFWYWVGKANPPYLYHCSHQDFANKNVRMPFPFQPDWIMEALGMAEYDPNKVYKVEVRGRQIELVEQAVTPQGQQVRKITVFVRSGNQYQVTGHVLEDTSGKEICTASILDIQQDRLTGAVLPKRVQLRWPAEKARLTMKFDGLIVNPQLNADRVARLFTRPTLQGVQSYNLAAGPDAPGGIQRAGAYTR